MNKQYMYIKDSIIVSDENGMKPAIPYVDNIEDMLIIENEIECLKRILEKDEKDLKEKNEEREYRTKDSKRMSVVGSVIAVGTTFGFSQLMGLSHEEITNTIVGPMSEYLAFSIPMSVGCVGFVQALSLLGLNYRPSKKVISALEERIKYSKEMIEIFENELNLLKEHPTYARKNEIKEMISYDVKCEYSLEYLREALNLRYAFGYNPKKYIKLYKEQELPQYLSNNGFSDDVIMDFYEFVSKKVDLELSEFISKKIEEELSEGDVVKK